MAVCPKGGRAMLKIIIGVVIVLVLAVVVGGVIMAAMVYGDESDE